MPVLFGSMAGKKLKPTANFAGKFSWGIINSENRG
jgi:hypothetical protein